MKIFKVLLFTCFILLFACGKDENESNGSIRLTSNSSNTYQVEINNNNRGTISGMSFSDYSLAPGSYEIVLTQLEGFVLYPTVVTYNTSLTAGEKQEFLFP